MSRPIPEVYVLWHPDSALGERLARRIHAWLRPGNGLGPQVFYRSFPAPEAPKGGLPPRLPGEHRPGPAAAEIQQPPLGAHTNMQVVVLLADAHMVADAAWRHWLTQLASEFPLPETTRVFFPVALDATAYNLPHPLPESNFLRPSGAADNLATTGDGTETLARSLLKQLTESLCRLLLKEAGADLAGVQRGAALVNGMQPKVMLFLSHAKRDGRVPAQKIRDYIYSQTQLAAFYDENDIAFGSAFSRVLQSNLAPTQTAALIAVRSELYSFRPWCRRELALFRRPQQEPAEAGTAERWRLNPMVVVDALGEKEQTVGIPELGNARVIRWSDTAPDQAEEIVTSILRDAFLGAFHAAVGHLVPPDPDCIALNWVPDPITLLHIPRVQSNMDDLRIFYPGRGLSGLELDILDEIFPRLSFHSFDQVVP